MARADINYSYTGWENIIDSPRPTYAIWFGDNWRVSNQLTINYGVRWDADPNTASAPNVKTNSIPINTGILYGVRYLATAAPTTVTRPAFTTGRTSRRASASPTTSAARTTS